MVWSPRCHDLELDSEHKIKTLILVCFLSSTLSSLHALYEPIKILYGVFGLVLF